MRLGISVGCLNLSTTLLNRLWFYAPQKTLFPSKKITLDIFNRLWDPAEFLSSRVVEELVVLELTSFAVGALTSLVW